MRVAKSLSYPAKPRLGLALLAILGFAPAAFAQIAPQNVTIGFSSLTPATVPLSGWLTGAIALMLTAAGLVVLRRRTAHRGRLSGWVMVLAGATTLALVTGQRVIPEAEAIVGPVTVINLSVSPASLNVAPFAPSTPLTVVVTNTTSQSVRIDSITLDAGPYSQTASTCVVTGVLAANAQCTITLAALS